MTDVDRVRDAEQRLREQLRRTLVPPRTPASLHATVDRLAKDPPRIGHERRTLRALGDRRRLEAVAGIAAVIAVAVGLITLIQIRNQQQVATSPQPTLPAVVASPLPSSGTTVPLLQSGEWVDTSTAWSFDQQDNLRISEDGGQTWSEPRPQPQPRDLGFGMFDAHNGYLGRARTIGNAYHLYVATTADGGRTWSDPMIEAGSLGIVGDPSTAGLRADLHFVDREHGVFVATAFDDRPGWHPDPGPTCKAFETNDGGATWAETDGPCLVYTDPPPVSAPSAETSTVTWFSPTVGAFASLEDARTVLTVDGGRTWTEGQLPVERSVGRRLFAITAPADGLIRLLASSLAGDGSAPTLGVYESTDNGATWNQHYAPIGLQADAIRDVSVLDAQHWLAASEVDSLGGMDLLETADAGRTWTVASHADIQPGAPMHWLDRLHGTIQGVPIRCNGGACGGDGTVLFTNDGGQSWHEIALSTAPPATPAATSAPSEARSPRA